MPKNLVLLGVGNSALAVARMVGADAGKSYARIIGTTRSAKRLAELPELISGIQAVSLQSITPDAAEIKDLADELIDADLLVSYPPDHNSDTVFSDIAVKARAIVYISSTGVYGKTTGVIDESSPTDSSSASASARLKSEKIWRDKGAVILRAPGLYNSQIGMHRRLLNGSYRIPGDGTNHVSRIHLDDLACIVLAALAKAKPGSLYVVGDECPATHLEVAQWLCDRLKIDLPDMVPLTEVHETLRGDRQVRSDLVMRDLNIQLRYPSFREGFADVTNLLQG